LHPDNKEAFQRHRKFAKKEDSAIMKPNFVFLVLEEHPYGREMLRILLENGFIPSLIIQEVSTVGDIEREKFLTRMAGQQLPPRLTELVCGKKIPILCVANHNDLNCQELLKASAPDVLALGGTRIIKTNILSIPGVTINVHPGLLPWLRGSSSVGWALYKDLPQGATAHFIDPGIDTGEIIVKRNLPVYRHDTYESLNARIATLSGQLMAESLSLIATGNPPRVSQDRNIGETLKVIPEDLLAEGKQRLTKGTYSHFSD
jgi:methionyl-tRNA formyltransferase